VVDAAGALVAPEANLVARGVSDVQFMAAARPIGVGVATVAAPESPDPAPLYHQVKQFIIGQIESGKWTAGVRVSSENEIVKEWGVSRQTANRALRELASEGYLTRIQGVGSFVAKSKHLSPALIVRSISDEIIERGHVHRAKVIALEEVEATDFIAWALQLAAGAPVFHSLILHFENDVPIQVEDRFVNPAAAPDYLKEDFTRITPNQHLMSVHPPLSVVEETIEAALPTKAVREWLEIDAREPCLIVRRRTWSGRLAVTQATLTHPGGSYRLLLHFRPGDRRS
jgi:GntR family transcriptional regulator, histidine utilization repressor